MALFECEECSKEISDKAKVCPYCGVEFSKSNSFAFKYRWIIYGAVVLVFIWILNLQGNEGKSSLIESLTNSVEYIYDDQLQIEEDYFHYFQLDLTRDTDVTIDYIIKSGPNLNVYFVSEDNFYIWDRIIKENINEPFQYNSDLSTFNTSKSSKTVTMPKGKYYIIFENTDYGPTYPPMNLENDFVTMDLTIMTNY
ncbi:hypothetical protein [Bacillus sp. ISL-37]|uniref:hypothetical protein n=1 Tax=Bacillus sp. ISL-37 TaxID=2819123 RepID=UPI001BEBA7C9|nr:hypothetical protein [Bacillus sp. ISL-37]MBT2685314.1 zinc ribbon domain-containing protein [Bacillus sp. ISL-37]